MKPTTPPFLVATLLLIACDPAPPGDGSGSSSGGSTTGDDTTHGSTSGAETTADPSVSSTSGSTGDASTSDSSSSSSGDPSTSSSSSSTTTGDTSADPVLEDDTLFALQDEALSVPATTGLLSNDTPLDTLSVTSFDATSTEGATVLVHPDGSVEYTPVDAFWGIDTFSYTATDSEGGEADATVTVHVAPASIPMADVEASAGGFIIENEPAHTMLGETVRSAGDINGDGLDDLLLSAPFYNGVANTDGRTYVVFGKADAETVDLADVASGVGGFVIDGEPGTGAIAISNVSFSGDDINGDGLDDIVLVSRTTAPLTNAGRTYVVFGKADTTAVELATVASGVGGFVVDGEAVNDSTLGASVGDINGDGLGDLLVIAPGTPPSATPHHCYVVFGKADTDSVQLSDVAMGTGGFLVQGQPGTTELGRRFSPAGDINDDGMNDVLVDAVYGSAPNRRARTYVVLGREETSTVALADVAAGTGGFIIDGEPTTSAITQIATGGHDVNGDGFHDILVGTYNADTSASNAGRSRIVFGKADTDPVELVDIDGGVGGFAIEGGVESEASGFAVSLAPDVNGDGLDDILLGAPMHLPMVVPEGRTYLVYGKADTATVQLTAVATGAGGFVMHHEQYGDEFGSTVSGVGDVNGDGLGDLLMSAQFLTAANPQAGRGYVVFGVRTQPE